VWNRFAMQCCMCPVYGKKKQLYKFEP